MNNILRALCAGCTVLLLSLAPVRAGTLLVAEPESHQVAFIDTASGQRRATAPTGAGPRDIAISPDGRLALVSNFGGASLSVLDIARGQARAIIALAPLQRPLSVRWLADGKRAVVTVQGAASVALVDVSAGRIDAQLGPAAKIERKAALSKDGQFIFLAAPAGGKIIKLALSGGAQVTISSDAAQAQAIVLAPDGKRLWVIDRGADAVKVFDSDTLQAIASLDAGNLPMAVSVTPNGRYALVSNTLSADVSVFDTATLEQTRIFSTRGVASNEPALPDEFGQPDTKRLAQISIPVAVIAAEDSASAFVMNNFTGEIIRFDIFSGAALRTYQSSQQPAAMAYSPVGAD